MWVSGWVVVRVGVCVCVGSRYLGCVSGGVATVISLGIRSSLGLGLVLGSEFAVARPTHAQGAAAPMPALSLARLRSLGRPRTGV